MVRFLRWCRGALAMGILWGAAWGGIFGALVIVIGLVDPAQIGPGEGFLTAAGYGALFGFVSGIVFALLLTLAEQRKAVPGLSLTRAALWGILGTAAYPLLTPVHDSMVLILCPIGAGLAAGSIALAKRARLQSNALPNAVVE